MFLGIFYLIFAKIYS